MSIGLTNHSKTLEFARLSALVSITVRTDEKFSSCSFPCSRKRSRDQVVVEDNILRMNQCHSRFSDRKYLANVSARDRAEIGRNKHISCNSSSTCTQAAMLSLALLARA